MEDKDKDLFLLDLSSFPCLQNQNPSSSPLPSIFVSLPNDLDPSNPSLKQRINRFRVLLTHYKYIQGKGNPLFDKCRFIIQKQSLALIILR